MSMGHGGTDERHGTTGARRGGIATKASRKPGDIRDALAGHGRVGRALAAALVVVSSVFVSAALSSQPASAASTAVLQGWGDNTYGELGNGTKSNETVPTDVKLPAGVTGFTAVAAGGEHTLAIGSDGNLYAWGDNGYGQLGNGTTTSSTTPVEVQMPAGIQATQIAAGLIDSLAIGSNGKVYAWGDNGYDELGDGNSTDSSVPVEVSLPSGVNKVAKIAAGQYHNLALTASGLVYAWGLNSAGQLGNGTTTTPTIPVKVAFPSGTVATNIAAGGYHSLATDNAGDLYAWGDNSNGQLGLASGDTTSESSPTLVDMPSGVSATQLAAGLYHSLAVGSDGTLYSWGYDADGELGHGNTTQDEIPRPVSLAGGATPTAIAAGQFDSYALLPNGTLYAWGQNGLGQLGDGNKTATLSQEEVSFATGSTVTALGTDSSSSDEFALATPAPSTTTTSLSASITSPVYGQTETLTATVTGSDGGGTVDFEAGVSSLSGCSAVALTASGSNYEAQCTTTTLATGANNLTAAYSGDSASAGSTSSNLGITVTPAPLTVSASSQATIYGSAPVPVTASFAGFENGDTATSLTTQPTCSTSENASSHVGDYATSCRGASDPNYSINYANGEVAVGPAPLSIAASSPMMTYGGAVPSVTPTYMGFQNDDSAASLTDAPACSTTATSEDPVGTYPSSCSGASDPDYTITYTAGSVVIGAAPLVIMASSVATTYGTAATAISPSYSGFLNGDTAASLTTQPTCGSTTTVTTGVGAYPSTCSGASDPNYSITYVNGTVTISPAPITITASSDSMIYGGSVPDIIPTVDGLQNNEGSSVLGAGLHCSTGATSVSDVGSYQSTCSGASDPNYSITYVNGSVSVTPAPVTVTASSDSMVYGGTVPTINSTADGLQNDQDASVLGTGLTCSTLATPTSPVGSYTSSCSGGSDANYSIEYVTGTTSITPAPLTITASSGSMTYGGTPPTIVPQVAGLQNGETVSVLGTGLECTTSAVSSSPVIPSGYQSTCSGAVDSNYDFNYVMGTVTVTPAPLSITASSASMSYGSAPPTITPTYEGLVNGDAAPATPPTCSTTATSSSPTGSYTSSCSGAADPDYDVSYSNGAVTVAQASLVIVASSGTMTYGSTPPTITPTYEGLVNGDAAPTTPPTCSTTATSSSPAGSYPSSCSGAADPDYAITYTSGEVVVGQATLIVVASSSSMTYGGTPPAITPTYVGLVNGDTAPSTPPTCSTTATSSSGVGTYPTTCSGAADSNYTIVYSDGTVHVDPAALTISASSSSMTYGGTPPAITPTYVGLVNGDTAPATPPTCSTGATSTSPVASYPTSCSGAADPDYTITYTNGTVTVDPAALTVTASSISMTYGAAPPDITASYSGFVNSDTATDLTTAPTCTTTVLPTTPVGTYASSCSGAVDPNYAFTYAAGTVTVSPAPLSITASSGSMQYGGTVPTITAVVTGLQNEEGTSVLTGLACSADATATSPVASYPTTCSGAVDDNYTISYSSGTLAVTPAPLTITASSDSITYGGTPSAITPIVSGLLNGETTAVLGPVTCSTAVVSTTSVGTYSSNCTGASDSNYAVTYVPGTVQVVQAPLVVAASSGSMSYGGTPPTITAKYTGFVNGENQSVLNSVPVCTTAATSSSPVGTYSSTCSGGSDNNYAFSYVAGQVVVGPSVLVISASSGTSTYGGTPSSVTPSYSGFLNGDTSSSLTTKPTCTSQASATSPVGNYANTCSGAVDPNYTIDYVAGSQNVTPASVTVQASSATMTYGSTPPAITPTVTGLVNGQGVSVLGSGLHCVSAATATSNVGSYASTCSGASDSNYTVTYASGTVTVTPAVLTVTANDQSMQFGSSVPALTATITGFVDGQTLSTSGVTGQASCTTTATSTSPVGTYQIVCQVGTLKATNYTFQFAPGTLTITATTTLACLTIGSVTVPAGHADRIAPGCTVIGSITVDAGGSLDSESALILGSLVSDGGTVRVCSTSFALYLSVTDAKTPVVLGDGTSDCGGSTLIGLVTLTSNTGGVSIQRADALGAIVVQKDSGGVTVINNAVLGDLTVTQNTGTVVDRPNTVYGLEQLQ